MIKLMVTILLFWSLSFGFSAYGGLEAHPKTTNLKIYSYDSTWIIVKKDGKKYRLKRSHVKDSFKPKVDDRIKLTESKAKEILEEVK